MQKIKLKQEHSFLILFEKFISDTKRGKRLQPNGKIISAGTINNYIDCKRLILKFCIDKGFHIRLRDERYLNLRETQVEYNYWKKFYRKFTDYLYSELGFYDNYIGGVIKNIKVFFNYLNKDTPVKVGNFHKLFYVRKEEVPIFPLLPEELNFLIYDQKFEQSLTGRMKEVKDVFVFGCTVGLRVSDLLSLKKSSLRLINEQYYLKVRSAKTKTDTLIKLPSYCMDILQKYSGRKKYGNAILPKFNHSNLNNYIKILLELAGFTQEVSVMREKRGEPVKLKNGQTKDKVFRFCDVASTHLMRRTAITTMLCLGMPEQVIRKISGHAPGTKEFYRYVLLAQAYQDQEVEMMHERLKQKVLKIV
jgi:integrase